jgi:hypothetical protein
MSKNDMVMLLVPEAEKNFSTGFDIVVGYIQAYEFTKSYFECGKLRNFDQNIPELQWTGNKTDLVEILMVLHKMKLFNHGKNDMKKLAEAFSKILNFEFPITTRPAFYIALTIMSIGSQLFLAGFIGEMISRTSTDRNNYNIKDKIGSF